MPESKTRKVSKRDAHDFLSKAEQFLRHSWGLGELVSWKSRLGDIVGFVSTQSQYLAPKLVLGHTNIRYAEHSLVERLPFLFLLKRRKTS
jgi:hypothetical protein